MLKFDFVLPLRSVPLDELVRHLESGKIAMILVDSCMLRCKQCKGFRWWQRSAPSERTQYCGHYIALVGHNNSAFGGEFVYRDPAKSDGIYIA